MTYMNVSGESVQKALAFFKLPLDRLLVLHDELDLPYRTLRLKVGGGLAGHNGLRSIAELCGGNDFLRLRIGIGRPPGAMSTEGWVLSDFDALDAAELPGVIARAAEMVERTLEAGPETAMREFHRKEKEEPPPA
jgi:PTH1 family peptidyl-tRNA hydrolase